MFLENIRLALHSLGANKLRTFLTMLGIMIGVGAVVAIETIGAGQTKQMEEQFAGNGVNNIQIYMWSENYDEDAPQLSFTQDMMKKFVNKFGDHIEAIEMDAYGNSGKAYLDAAKQDETYANFYQQGVNNGAFTVENVKLKEGRTFTGDELNNASNAAVVSDKFVDNMWGGDYAGASAGASPRISEMIRRHPIQSWVCIRTRLMHSPCGRWIRKTSRACQHRCSFLTRM